MSKFRVWDGKTMHYADGSEDYYISMAGKLHSMGETEDLEGGLSDYLYESPSGPFMKQVPDWKSSDGNPLWESDIVVDSGGNIGVIVEWSEEACWGVDYDGEIDALAEYSNGSYRVLGNIHQHPDWKNWDGGQG